MNTKWKDFLLKSGLPLENDVKKYINSKGYIAYSDYSYSKQDENRDYKEFSFDINAVNIKNNIFIELMIECKYRHEETKWIFIPEDYGGINEIHENDFIHVNDHFCKNNNKFIFDKIKFPKMLAPLCSKGIEILSDDKNEKTLPQAFSQIAYAFAVKFISDIDNQINNGLGGTEYIFFNIPIIVTTANLYRLKENIDISSIKDAKIIDDIAVKHDILISNYIISEDLKKHNCNIFSKFIKTETLKKLEGKINTFNNDVKFFFNAIAEHYCPNVFIIINFNKKNDGFEKFFKYLNELIDPSEKFLNEVMKYNKRIKNKFRKEFKKKKRTHNTL